MLRRSFLILLVIILLINCKSETTNSNSEVITETATTNTATTVTSIQNKIVYDFKITSIDSVRFNAAALGRKVYPEPKIIQDINLIKKVLKDRITMQPYEDTDQLYVTELLTKKGKKIKIPHYYINSLIGYYPAEDILLLEGGHSEDVSYNLTTGNTTQVAGNPEYMLLSPNRIFRLNGYFDGQESIRYFIEKNEEGRFKKVVSVNEEINTDKVPEFFCVLEDHFWKDDHTIYFYMVRYEGTVPRAIKDYYQLQIIEQKQ